MTEIIAIPAFTDNYIWMLVQPGGSAIVIDPGEAEPVIEQLKSRGLKLLAIFATHHHYDHTDGIEQLLQYARVPVFGGSRDPIPYLTDPVYDGDTIDSHIDPQLIIPHRVIEIPGHTHGHVAYVGKLWVFCGDTLFTAGCGKVFEGTPSQMFQSLSKLKSLSQNLSIYCGHEYTLQNLRFAQGVEPNNLAIQNRIKKVEDLRKMGLPSVPSILAEELETNPFLRTDKPSVIQAAEHHLGRPLQNEVETFTVLRDWKNHFS